VESPEKPRRFTYSSRLDRAEVLFNLVQVRVIRRGKFPSKQDLAAKLLANIALQPTETDLPLDKDG
jgi:hypothetical protein